MSKQRIIEIKRVYTYPRDPIVSDEWIMDGAKWKDIRTRGGYVCGEDTLGYFKGNKLKFYKELFELYGENGFALHSSVDFTNLAPKNFNKKYNKLENIWVYEQGIQNLDLPKGDYIKRKNLAKILNSKRKPESIRRERAKNRFLEEVVQNPDFLKNIEKELNTPYLDKRVPEIEMRGYLSVLLNRSELRPVKDITNPPCAGLRSYYVEPSTKEVLSIINEEVEKYKKEKTK
jgi:hypothetical protein